MAEWPVTNSLSHLHGLCSVRVHARRGGAGQDLSVTREMRRDEGGAEEEENDDGDRRCRRERSVIVCVYIYICINICTCK